MVPFAKFDADLDVYLAHTRATDEARPYVVLVRRSGKVVGAAMARLQRATLDVRLGFKLRYAPRLISIVGVHGGVWDSDEPSVAEAIVRTIDDSLRRREAEACFLPSLLEGSAVLDALHTVSRWRRGGFEPHKASPFVELPATFDEFISRRSKNTRSRIRRCQRQLLEQLPEARVRCFTKPDDLGELIEDLERVAQTTWQRQLGGGFVASKAEIETYRIAAARGLLRAWVLYDGLQPISFSVGWVHRRGFRSRFLGFDPRYGDVRAGLFVQLASIADLCADETVDFLDFGSGQTEVKRMLSDRSQLETDRTLFAPGPRPAVANALRTTANGYATLARAAIANLSAVNRARTAWRRRVAGASGGS